MTFTHWLARPDSVLLGILAQVWQRLVTPLQHGYVIEGVPFSNDEFVESIMFKRCWLIHTVAVAFHFTSSNVTRFLKQLKTNLI